MTDEERQENAEKYAAKRIYKSLVQLNKDMYDGAKIIDIGLLSEFDIKSCITEMKSLAYSGEKPPQQFEALEDL